MGKLILATSSPYRQEAFRFLDLDFIAEASNIKEDFEGRPNNPEELVSHLAKLKAQSIAKNHKEGVVIGFDSVSWFNNQIVEKPKTRQEAFERLKFLSENSFEFFTGIHMINLNTNQILSKTVKTEVFMRKIDDSEIEKYLNQDPDFVKIGPGYDSLKNYSVTFAKSIIGSYNNITRGIPLETIIEMLKEIGYQI